MLGAWHAPSDTIREWERIPRVPQPAEGLRSSIGVDSSGEMTCTEECGGPWHLRPFYVSHECIIIHGIIFWHQTGCSKKNVTPWCLVPNLLPGLQTLLLTMLRASLAVFAQNRMTWFTKTHCENTVGLEFSCFFHILWAKFVPDLIFRLTEISYLHHTFSQYFSARTQTKLLPISISFTSDLDLFVAPPLIFINTNASLSHLVFLQSQLCHPALLLLLVHAWPMWLPAAKRQM